MTPHTNPNRSSCMKENLASDENQLRSQNGSMSQMVYGRQHGAVDGKNVYFPSLPGHCGHVRTPSHISSCLLLFLQSFCPEATAQPG